ncbi:Hsp70 family protein [Flaviaesturariibacter terrae]
MKFINFGIDLGTTNSLIARFQNGEVQVFKNPLSGKETLPSVVAFRGDRVLVGEKARELVAKDPVNVIGSFKRKMGTDEQYRITATGGSSTPMSLSALVLRELKTFVHTGEPVDSVVITIPASFDTIQSNATKKAGYEAGFREVVLLQEPIAASLAYFNESRNGIPSEGSWLVYDLGGGTFDVALVRVVDGELRVEDHEGNNFLGGLDFDTGIVETLIIPEIVKQTGDESIAEAIRQREGAYEGLFFVLQYKAETAKKELSVQAETEIEFTLPDGKEIYMRVSRADLEPVFAEKTDASITLIRSMLQRNNLAAGDIQQIIMVGGSTYIPYVRGQVAAQTGIPLAFDADPTTAVAVGAAYFAGSHLAQEGSIDTLPTTEDAVPSHRVKAVFPTVSSEDEELYMAIPEEGDFSQLFYRITRADGGYDSGTRPVGARISEFLPLLKGSKNLFEIRFTDAQNNSVPVAHPPFAIQHGKFNVAGQPLPNDICLEVDDLENNRTKLQLLFERNSILPLRKTVYKEITRTISKASRDSLVINVLEGTRHSRPHSNLHIGAIEIHGSDLKTDLVKGSDVEIRFEMNESRDLTITAYLAMADQEFRNVFSTSEKQVSIVRLKDDLRLLVREMRSELRDEKGRDEESEWSGELRQCIYDAEKLLSRLERVSDKDNGDEKWAISEERRRISARYDALGSEQRVYTLQADYLRLKNFCDETLPHVDLDQDKLVADYDRIVQDEAVFLRSRSSSVLRAKIDSLEQLRMRILSNTRYFITNIFLNLCELPPESFTKPAVAQTLMKQGEEALTQQRFPELRNAAIHLSHLVDDPDELEAIKIKGTGIG